MSLRLQSISSSTWTNWYLHLLEEHAPYKRGVVRPEMSFAKILTVELCLKTSG